LAGSEDRLSSRALSDRNSSGYCSLFVLVVNLFCPVLTSPIRALVVLYLER
jgi:hypothetical protein